MELREFFSEDAIELNLASTSKDDVLKELIGLLKLDERITVGKADVRGGSGVFRHHD